MGCDEMKKTVKTILSVVLALAIMFCAVACGPSLDDEVKNGTDVDISEPDYGFIERESFTPNAENPLEGTKDEKEIKKFYVGTTYYLIIVFTLTPRQENDGQSYFKTTAKFDNLDVLDATMQQASTSSTVVEIEHDMLEDKVTRNVQASFKIPSNPEVVKRYTMIVRMVPNKASGSSGVQLKINFSLEGNYTIRGNGDGFTRSIDIDKGTLAIPEPSYNSYDGKLKWKHVKNASYYVVYDGNDNKLMFDNGNGERSEKIMVTPDIKAGEDDMSVSLYNAWINGSKLSGYKELRVKAFGKDGETDESFYSSKFSETVTATVI